jgi:hypothetical protein
MAQRQLATSSTAQIDNPDQIAFSIRSVHFRDGKKPVISVEGLAGAETLSFWYQTNDDWEELDDGSGTQVAYTATYAADTFNGPGVYGYTKDATVGAIVLSLDDGL